MEGDFTVLAGEGDARRVWSLGYYCRYRQKRGKHTGDVKDVAKDKGVAGSSGESQCAAVGRWNNGAIGYCHIFGAWRDVSKVFNIARHMG